LVGKCEPVDFDLGQGGEPGELAEESGQQDAQLVAEKPQDERCPSSCDIQGRPELEQRFQVIPQGEKEKGEKQERPGQMDEPVARFPEVLL
jgi:hypothetical protein